MPRAPEPKLNALPGTLDDFRAIVAGSKAEAEPEGVGVAFNPAYDWKPCCCGAAPCEGVVWEESVVLGRDELLSDEEPVKCFKYSSEKMFEKPRTHL